MPTKEGISRAHLSLTRYPDDGNSPKLRYSRQQGIKSPLNLTNFKQFLMSQLHQMQLSYVSEEDRILLRMNTRARQEFRFWITRRYVELLWKTITKIVEKREEKETEVRDELKKAAQIQEKHEKSVEKSDFQTQYQESTYLPLGEAPALLFSAGIKPDAEGRAMLSMHPKDGQGIELALNDQIVHSFCKLLADTSEKANWKLDLSWSNVQPKEEPGGGDGGLN